MSITDEDKDILFSKITFYAGIKISNSLPRTIRILTNEKLKGKAVPLQAWSGPEGSRKLKFPDYMTTEQDGGKVVSHTNRPPLPPGNAPGTHFC